MFCEPDHDGSCQALAPKCVISQSSLRDLSQSRTESLAARKLTPEKTFVFI